MLGHLEGEYEFVRARASDVTRRDPPDSVITVDHPQPDGWSAKHRDILVEIELDLDRFANQVGVSACRRPDHGDCSPLHHLRLRRRSEQRAGEESERGKAAQAVREEMAGLPARAGRPGGAAVGGRSRGDGRKRTSRRGRPQAARCALPAIAASAGARCAPAIGKTAEAITLGSRLSALGSRLSALGSRLSALGSLIVGIILSPRRTLHDTPEARKVPAPLFADEAHPPAADNQLSRFSMTCPHIAKA